MPKLAALLDIPSLALNWRCGDPERPFAAVRRLDQPTDTAWLSAGDLRLGETWEPRSQPDPYFLAQPAAIGYALTPKRRELPPALVVQAEKRGLCLFTIPPSTSAERVQQEALRLIAAENSSAMRAGASVQRYLLESLDSPKPERELLDRLHLVSGASFVLLSTWGEVLARSGPASFSGLEGSLEALAEGRYELWGRAALLFRLEQAGRLRGVLIALGAGLELLPLCELARGILRLRILERDAELKQQQAQRATLLSEWLAGGEVAELEGRLAQAGFEPEEAYAVAVLELPPRRHQQPREKFFEQFKQAGDEFFAYLGLPALSALRGDHLLWVFPGAEPEARLAPLVQSLKVASQQPFRLGTSLVQKDARRLATAYRQALLATQTVEGDQAGKSFSQLDPISWVLEQQPEANLRALHEQLLGPLKTADKGGRLWRTLESYLRAPQDLTRLAEKLHIHVNTLRYRLGKIEALSGQSLSQPQSLAKLYLAVQVDAMLERERRP